MLEITSLLIHSTSILLRYTNQSIDVDHKSIDWFLNDGMCLLKETMLYLQWAIGIIFEHEEVQGERDFTIGQILPSQIHKVRYSVIIIP